MEDEIQCKRLENGLSNEFFDTRVVEFFKNMTTGGFCGHRLLVEALQMVPIRYERPNKIHVAVPFGMEQDKLREIRGAVRAEYSPLELEVVFLSADPDSIDNAIKRHYKGGVGVWQSSDGSVSRRHRY